ncbi:glycoside hydrolase family 5 protein [Paraburkholderia sp. RL17-373-BIF-A]|uniref:glycoside hydrolase family 5 protein n=1 Tax=Paraburkholderia sp. RL17-373-BIF-A TaxID=3031629 RepID=UPI0038B8274B
MKRYIITGASFALHLNIANAAISVTNEIHGTLDPAASGYFHSRPVICVKNESGGQVTYKKVLPGETAVLSWGNPYWYDADLRLNGCDVSMDPYVGYLGIATTGVSFTPWTNGKIQYVDPAKNANGVISGKLKYVPLSSMYNSQLLRPVAKNRQLPYVGVNFSGAEFGKTIAPSSVPDLAGLDLSDMNNGKGEGYVSAGMNTVRFPIGWGFLELLDKSSSLENPTWIFNEAYWKSYVEPTVVSLTSAGIYTILDLHAYLHYSEFGKHVSGCMDTVKACPDGTRDLNSAHYIKAWQDILAKIRENPQIREDYLMFDVVNEPAASQNEVLTPRQVFDTEVPVAVALQKSGFTGKILLEGASWSGLHSWLLRESDQPSNGEVFTRENLQNAGVMFNANNDNVVLSVHQYFDANFSGTQDSCQTSLSTTGYAGFNVGAFSQWLTAQSLKAIVTELGSSNRDTGGHCPAILADFMTYMKKNAAVGSGGGFVGATLWGAGHGWGASYDLRITPSSYQFTIMKQTLVQ